MCYLRKITTYLLVFFWSFCANTEFAQTDLNKKEFNVPISWNSLPTESTKGLNLPGLMLKGYFYYSSLGDYCIVKLFLESSTWNNPLPRFSMSWVQDGVQWGDNEIGREPFYTIQPNLDNWGLTVRIIDPLGNIVVKKVGMHGEVYFPWVKGKSNISRCEIYVDEVRYLTYKMETYSAFTAAINNVKRREKEKENERLKQEQFEKQRVENERLERERKEREQRERLEKERQLQSQKTKLESQTNDIGNSRNQPMNSKQDQNTTQKINQIFRDENGNFWAKLPDGTFAELDDVHQRELKESYKQQQAAELLRKQEIAKKEREQQLQTQLEQMRREQEAVEQRAAQIENDINNVSNVLIQNFYQGEAMRNGWNKIYELSMMSGNYQSISEIEQIYRSNYKQISQEASKIHNARMGSYVSGLNVLSTMSDPVSAGVGGGILAVGTIVASANADKKEREAKERLLAERNAAIFNFKTKRKNSRLRIFKDFPEGGTPLEQHKIGSPEVYFLAYYIDTSKLFDEKPVLKVSNVFSIPKERDGTYMFKSTLMKKVRTAFGENAILVGYFIQQNNVITIRNRLIELASLAEYQVEAVNIKFKSSIDIQNEVSLDFWGEVAPSPNARIQEIKSQSVNSSNSKKTPVKDEFWDD